MNNNMSKNLLSVSIFMASAGLMQPVTSQTLEEVTVTAQKREQSMQDVPVQVSTVSGDALEKLSIIDASDIALLAPTLNFDSADEARLFNFSIRGVGTRSFSIGVEPSVSTVVDGVVLTRIGNAFDTLGDIEQVEVLAGPQGTLFGKNSSAGVVSIRTKRPNTQEFEGKVDVTLAEDNERRLGLSLSAPLSETLAYRVYAFNRSVDGTAKNLFDGSDENSVDAKGLRGKLLWEPSAALSMLFMADYSEKDSNCCAMAPHAVDGGQGASNARFNLETGDLDLANGYAVTTPEFLGIAADKYGNLIKADVDQVNEQENQGTSLEVNYSLDSGSTITSVTAYREWISYTSRDRDSSHAQLSGLNANELAWMMGTADLNVAATQAQIDEARTQLQAISYNSLDFMTNDDGTIGTNNSNEFNETFSQEIRITSPEGERLDYIAGIYFGDQFVERDLTIAGKWNRTGGGMTTNPIANIDPVTGEVTCSTVACYKFGDTITSVDTRNIGVFGHLNYHLTDDVTLFGGLRYIDEKSTWKLLDSVGPWGNHFSFLKLIESVPYLNQLAEAAYGGNVDARTKLASLTGDDIAAGDDMALATYQASVATAQEAIDSVSGSAVNGGLGALEFEKDYSDSTVIYKLGVQYNIDDNLMAYGSYGTGYKSPAVNADIFIFDAVGDVLNAPTQPEESRGFEIGLKGSFDSLRFDLTYYDTDIDGLHTDGSATGGGSRAVGRLVAGDVNSSGVEGNFTWAATNALTVNGGFSVGEAVLDDPTVTVGGASADGTRILLAPDVKYNVGLDYAFDIGSYPSGLYWTYSYTDETFYGFGENQPRDDFAISNLAMDVSSPEDTWTLSVFVKNLFDEQYNSSLRSVSSTQGGGAMHTVARDHNRYAGATFNYRF